MPTDQCCMAVWETTGIRVFQVLKLCNFTIRHLAFRWFAKLCGERKIDKIFLDAGMDRYGSCIVSWDLWLLEVGKHRSWVVLCFGGWRAYFHCLQMIWVLETISQYPARSKLNLYFKLLRHKTTQTAREWIGELIRRVLCQGQKQNCEAILEHVLDILISVSLWNIFQTLWNCPTFTVSSLVGLHPREPRMQAPLILVCIAVELRNEEIWNTSRKKNAGNLEKSTTGIQKKTDICPDWRAFLFSLLRFLSRKGSPLSGPNIGIIKASTNFGPKSVPKLSKTLRLIRLEQSSCTNNRFRYSCTVGSTEVEKQRSHSRWLFDVDQKVGERNR